MPWAGAQARKRIFDRLGQRRFAGDLAQLLFKPDPQVIKDRLGIFLAQGHAFGYWQEPRLRLNIIEPFNPQNGFARHKQLGALIKLKELTPHMRNLLPDRRLRSDLPTGHEDGLRLKHKIVDYI